MVDLIIALINGSRKICSNNPIQSIIKYNSENISVPAGNSKTIKSHKTMFPMVQTKVGLCS